jgi:type IV secretion system protein VirB11
MTRAGLASAGNVVPLQGAVILELDPEERTALELTLTHLRPLLAGDNVTEICINEPGRVFIEDHNGWHVEQCPFVSLAWCEALSRLVGNATKQRVNAQEPLLSGELPTGERFQIVLPPATTKETVSVTLRVPSRQVWTLDEIAERGMLAECRWSHDHSYDDPSHPQYR